MNDRRRFAFDGLVAQIDMAHDELAALLIAGDRHAAERVIAGLGVLVWHRRAAHVRGRRHAGPRLRSVPRRADREGA